MRPTHARSSRVRLFATCCGMRAVVASGPARADSISLSAGATYSVDFAPSQTVSAARPPDSTDPNIFPSTSGVHGSTVFGHDYSSQPTGLYQFDSRSSGERDYSISGSANYTDTFTVSAGGHTPFTSISTPEN
jgi:hypothetical protein